MSNSRRLAQGVRRRHRRYRGYLIEQARGYRKRRIATRIGGKRYFVVLNVQNRYAVSRHFTKPMGSKGSARRAVTRARTRQRATSRSGSSGGGSGGGDDDGGGGDDDGEQAVPAHVLREVPRQVEYVPPAALAEAPSASMVPAMRSSEFDDLVADIRANGIKVPLEVDGKTVLDGRHRLRAARQLRLEKVPIINAALGGDSKELYLLKAAVLRRQLTDDQRAMIAARWARKNPRSKGGDRRSKRAAAETKRDDGSPVDSHPARTHAAAAVGASPAKVKQAIRLLNADQALAEQVHAGTIKLADATRTVARARQIKQIASAKPLEGKFTTLSIDPPWAYDDENCQGAAALQYPTMTLDEIRKLPVQEHAGDAAHLYLWTTNSHLEAALQIVREWGFDYKTLLTWVKPQLGLGRYFRGCTEHVLFCTRGNLPLKARDIPNWFEADRKAHSEKPDQFYALVERASPGPYLDWFSRRAREGWTCHGAEVDSGAIHPEGADVKSDDDNSAGET
jgi:N6-adenosine-specific RNA methylase IME4